MAQSPFGTPPMKQREYSHPLLVSCNFFPCGWYATNPEALIHLAMSQRLTDFFSVTKVHSSETETRTLICHFCPGVLWTIFISSREKPLLSFRSRQGTIHFHKNSFEMQDWVYLDTLQFHVFSFNILVFCNSWKWILFADQFACNWFTCWYCILSNDLLINV